MKPKKNSLPDLHPKAQLLITGKPILASQAVELISFSADLCFRNWCSADGAIGHIDSIMPRSSYSQLTGDLKKLAERFKFLDLGVSVMSGPPGTFTMPLVSFLLKNGEMMKTNDVHFGHPPPKRMKT